MFFPHHFHGFPWFSTIFLAKQAVCGEEESLSYCEFLAALIPSIEDAFEDVAPEVQAHFHPFGRDFEGF